jgi:tetratricopeptide (TPR) repeat protein
MSISSSDYRAIANYNEAMNLHNVKKDFQGSIDLLNIAINIDPEYGKAYMNRGSSYFQLGYYDKAIADYTKAIEVAPDFAMAYNFKGVMLFQRGNKEEGLKLVEKALKLDPNDHEIYQNYIAMQRA